MQLLPLKTVYMQRVSLVLQVYWLYFFLFIPSLHFHLLCPFQTSLVSSIFIYVLVSVLVNLWSSLCVLLSILLHSSCLRSVHVAVCTCSFVASKCAVFHGFHLAQIIISSYDGCPGWLELLGTNNSVINIFLHVASGCGIVSWGTYIQTSYCWVMG